MCSFIKLYLRNVGGNLPVGTIIIWSLNTLPKDGHWIEYNGQSTLNYPKLNNIIGNNVPDYHGYFLRGLGGNSNTLGIEPQNAIRNILGEIDALTSPPFEKAFGEINKEHLNISGAFNGIFSATYPPADGYGYSEINHLTGFMFDTSKIVPTDIENRPINKSFKYLIKAK